MSFCFGKLSRFTFDVSGIPHSVVLNAGYDYNQAKITSDLTKFVSWFEKLFGELPYKHYTFFIRVGKDGFGGIEQAHHNYLLHNYYLIFFLLMRYGNPNAQDKQI